MYEERLRESLPRVQERMAAALVRAGRGGEVLLVAVTKGHPVAAVEAAWRAGIRVVGENRVQELESKRGELSGAGGPAWHLIGHLQRNKVKRTLALCDMIESVDSLRLAQELSREAELQGRTVRALLQVNVSGEATKGGFQGAGAVAEIGAAAALPGLSCEGLMTMAPFTDDQARIRATFAAARTLLQQCRAEGAPLRGAELSMGMSNDYELAIEEGSTMIRLGTVLFGERAP